MAETFISPIASARCCALERGGKKKKKRGERGGKSTASPQDRTQKANPLFLQRCAASSIALSARLSKKREKRKRKGEKRARGDEKPLRPRSRMIVPMVVRHTVGVVRVFIERH